MGSMMNFVLNSILLGVGLAMDAFSVSIANGLNEPGMSRKKTYGIAACYAFFQFAMPMIGWFCVHTIASYFKVFQKFIPLDCAGSSSVYRRSDAVRGNPKDKK